MPLVNCPHCGGTISTTADRCPHCGAAAAAAPAERQCPECRRAATWSGATCPLCGYDPRVARQQAAPVIVQDSGTSKGVIIGVVAVAAVAALPFISIIVIAVFVALGPQIKNMFANSVEPRSPDEQKAEISRMMYEVPEPDAPPAPPDAGEWK